MANMASWVRYATTQGLLLRVGPASLCKRQMTSGKFAVRRLTAAEEVRQLFSEKAALQGWRPGALDHESFFAADKTGFFVGELDGEAISSMHAIKFSDDYAFIGNYLVDERYRGYGYGLRTWKAAMGSLPEGCNVAGDGIEEMVPLYEKFGFKRAWCTQRLDFVASKAASAPSLC